jgi:CBS domain-containing protein
MIGVGVYQVLVLGNIWGLWTAFIGWFLNNAADAARREQQAEYEFTGALVRDVMQPDPVTVLSSVSVDELVRECFIKRGCRAAAVMESGRLVGIVSLTDVRRIGQSDWAKTPVAAVMTVNPLHTVASSESVDVALKLLAEKDINQAMVLDGGQLVGMISREGLMRFVRVRRELGVRRPGA